MSKHPVRGSQRDTNYVFSDCSNFSFFLPIIFFHVATFVPLMSHIQLSKRLQCHLTKQPNSPIPRNSTVEPSCAEYKSPQLSPNSLVPDRPPLNPPKFPFPPYCLRNFLRFRRLQIVPGNEQINGEQLQCVCNSNCGAKWSSGCGRNPCKSAGGKLLIAETPPIPPGCISRCLLGLSRSPEFASRNFWLRSGTVSSPEVLSSLPTKKACGFPNLILSCSVAGFPLAMNLHVRIFVITEPHPVLSLRIMGSISSSHALHCNPKAQRCNAADATTEAAFFWPDKSIAGASPIGHCLEEKCLEDDNRKLRSKSIRPCNTAHNNALPSVSPTHTY